MSLQIFLWIHQVSNTNKYDGKYCVLDILHEYCQCVFCQKKESVICSKQMFVRKKLKKKCMQRTDVFYFYYLNLIVVLSERNNNINVYRKMTEYMFVILRWQW